MEKAKGYAHARNFLLQDAWFRKVIEIAIDGIQMGCFFVYGFAEKCPLAFF